MILQSKLSRLEINSNGLNCNTLSTYLVHSDLVRISKKNFKIVTDDTCLLKSTICGNYHYIEMETLFWDSIHLEYFNSTMNKGISRRDLLRLEKYRSVDDQIKLIIYDKIDGIICMRSICPSVNCTIYYKNKLIKGVILLNIPMFLYELKDFVFSNLSCNH